VVGDSRRIIQESCPATNGSLHPTRIQQLLSLQDKLREDTIFAGPDPRSDAFLTPGFGTRNARKIRIRMNIPGIIFPKTFLD
jgi:hypothetical protein